jgi:hypothetical protein
MSVDRRAMLALITLISTAVLCPPLQAAEAERQRGPWLLGFSGGVLHQFETNLADAAGEFNASRGFVQGSLSYLWDRRNTVSVSFGAGRTNYDFSLDANIENLLPWEQIEDYRLSLPIRFAAGERADVLIMPRIQTFAETNASLNDGRTEGVLAGFSWKFSDSFSLGPGFGWFSELGGGSNAFPILVIDWQITEKWRLSTGRGVAASQGPGLNLSYQLAPKWFLDLAGRFERIRFALEERPDELAFGQERSLPLVLQASYRPSPALSLTAMVGAEFEGSLRLYDGQGQRIARTDFDTAPVAGLAFSARF